MITQDHFAHKQVCLLQGTVFFDCVDSSLEGRNSIACFPAPASNVLLKAHLMDIISMQYSVTQSN